MLPLSWSPSWAAHLLTHFRLGFFFQQSSLLPIFHRLYMLSRPTIPSFVVILGCWINIIFLFLEIWGEDRMCIHTTVFIILPTIILTVVMSGIFLNFSYKNIWTLISYISYIHTHITLLNSILITKVIEVYLYKIKRETLSPRHHLQSYSSELTPI